jgi:hypothetical protein
MEQIKDRHKRIVITVSKKPHTGSLLNAAAPQRSVGGAKADEESTRRAMSVLTSLQRLFHHG